MITLSVEKYCHNCNRFEPEARGVPTLRITSLFATEADLQASDVIVRCKYHERCKAIETDIRKQIAEEQNVGGQKG